MDDVDAVLDEAERVESVNGKVGAFGGSALVERSQRGWQRMIGRVPKRAVTPAPVGTTRPHRSHRPVDMART